jgi:CheY-like chemotaxis protein
MKKILLIEDSDDIRETTAELLELAGYTLTTAENGKIGVEKALETKPDLVICDIMMPVLDGFGVLHIFSQNPDLQAIPFIFLTAKTERGDFRKGMEMGADDYLTKPFQEIELLNAVERRFQKIETLTKSLQTPTEVLEKLYDEARQQPDLATLLSHQRKPQIFKKKQLIFHEGDEPTKCFFLKSGRVRTFQLNRDGKAFTTGLYNTGDSFGYVALIENTDYQESAEALEDAEIVNIPKQEFLDLLIKNQQIAQKCTRTRAAVGQIGLRFYSQTHCRCADNTLQKIQKRSARIVHHSHLTRRLGLYCGHGHRVAHQNTERLQS